MNWMHPLNDHSSGKKIVITGSTVKDSESRRDVNAVQLNIGSLNEMLHDCEEVVLTKKEWVELRRKINDHFK